MYVNNVHRNKFCNITGLYVNIDFSLYCRFNSPFNIYRAVSYIFTVAMTITNLISRKAPVLNPLSRIVRPDPSPPEGNL